MRYLGFVALLLLAFSCNSDDDLQGLSLADYIENNGSPDLADIVACAGGSESGLFGLETEPTDVFFYPIEGATDFQYFEAENVADSLNFEKYFKKELTDEALFNGYLWKFNNIPFTGERMGVVTYRTPGNLHACTPIRLKTNVKPTEVNNDLGEVIESGVNPSFVWEDGNIDDSVIYFQVISDANDNFISGTYTIDKEFTFYDLSNVVFNITDTTSVPTLEAGQDYNFTLMAVSEDNWVNLIIQKEFSAE